MLEAGKVAHWLRPLAAFSENLSSLSSVQAVLTSEPQPLTTIAPGEPAAAFWPPWALQVDGLDL